MDLCVQASYSKCDPDTQGSNSSGSCCEIRENPSSDLFSPSAVDSPYAESTGSQCAETATLHSVESSDSHCMGSVGSPCIEPTGSSCIDSLSLSVAKSTDSDTVNFRSVRPSFSLHSVSLSCIESSGLSSMESYGPSSLESISSVESTSSSSAKSTCLFSSEPGCSQNTESSAKLCIICCASPANASIIHGKYAHQVSCYRCACILKKRKKGCPVCRRTIEKVVHQINM